MMTKENQAGLTPDDILHQFMEGNKRFQTGKVTLRAFNEHISQSSQEQFPKAVVLSCIDSRVPVEHVLDQGMGDIFVCRVAGNIVDEDQLGSIEFACKLAGAKLVLVMGHQHCGAVKGAIEDVQIGNLGPLLAKIKPAIGMCDDFTGEKSSANEAFVRCVTENNVRNTINQIRERSPILREMEESGEIDIVGAYYCLEAGQVYFLDRA
jgi:carbonic anhydrase